MKTALSLVLGLICLGLCQSAQAQTSGVHRFALVAGSNDGGSGRVKLRYATSDADAISSVLQEIGGVAQEDLVTLSNPDPDAMREAFVKMKAMVASSKKKSSRTEIFFYYSGHSDEEGLLLNGVLFKYSDLRSLINDVNADVRVAIVDSCASGALTLQKGGTKKPPFLRDDSTAVKGRAFLTSSSADEVAQESERIGGSFFTYYLVSGLRGAADSTRDGKITLHEAYQYAFSETLARTENTKYGPQHPAYEIQLTGTGDLVMTDLRETSATISLESTLAGQLYVRDSKGRLVCELRKESGASSELALAPGTYKINIERDKKLYQTSISVEKGKKQNLGAKNFTETNLENTQARGDEPSLPSNAAPLDLTNATPQEEAGDALNPEATPPVEAAKPKRLALNLSLTPNLNLGRVFGDRTVSTFSLGFFDGNRSLHGVSIGLLTSYVSEDLQGVQITPGIAMARKEVRGGQIGAVGTFAQQDVKGFQVGSGAVVGGDMIGLQASASLNIVGGSFTGLQATALYNSVAGDFTGLQAAADNVVGGNFLGLQASGGLNLVGKDMTGLQAGIINFVREDAQGLQAGVVNKVNGDMRGLQASVANLNAGRTDGLQAGVINISRDVFGAQVGVINIAKNVKGAQVGVFNIAKEVDGAPIGVFNFIQNGMHRVDVWGNDLSPLNIGLRLGGQHAYTLLTCGVLPSALETNFTCGGGVGARHQGKLLSLNLDATTSSLVNKPNGEMFNAARLFAEFQPSKKLPLSVFAGPTLNAIVAFGAKVPSARDVLPGQLYRGDNASLLLTPGFVLGVSL